MLFRIHYRNSRGSVKSSIDPTERPTFTVSQFWKFERNFEIEIGNLKNEKFADILYFSIDFGDNFFPIDFVDFCFVFLRLPRDFSVTFPRQPPYKASH